jgi:hypothetical protein
MTCTPCDGSRGSGQVRFHQAQCSLTTPQCHGVCLHDGKLGYLFLRSHSGPVWTSRHCLKGPGKARYKPVSRLVSRDRPMMSSIPLSSSVVVSSVFGSQVSLPGSSSALAFLPPVGFSSAGLFHPNADKCQGTCRGCPA